MNALKLVISVALIAGIWFFLFASHLPDEIEFRGQTLGPRERVENNSTREFDIYSYADRTRNHLLLFVMATEPSPTSQELLEFYVEGFKAQGYAIRNQGARYLGTKGEEVLYVARARAIDSAVVYAAKSPDAPRSFREADSIFAELEGFAFD